MRSMPHLLSYLFLAENRHRHLTCSSKSLINSSLSDYPHTSLCLSSSLVLAPLPVVPLPQQATRAAHGLCRQPSIAPP